jgi:hypothetical protein
MAARLASLLALVMALLALLALLAGSVQARSSTCRAGSAGHGHGPRACAGSSRGSSAHGRRGAKPRRRKHAARAHKHSKPGRPAGATPAVCEDGQAPLVAAEGAISCADGSEPVCADGGSPRVSASRVICPVAAAEGQEEGEAGEGGCQDESACSYASSSEAVEDPCEDGPASKEADGSFLCGDGSEPSCIDGYSLTLSPDGSQLFCAADGGDLES